LDISLKSAEVQKREHGSALRPQGVGRRKGDPPPDELGSILHGILRCDLKDLATEVKRSYEYILSCYPPKQAADLVLVGGGAALRSLPEFLSEALGISVRPASSYVDGEMCRLRYASGKQNPLEVFGLAVGLALGG
jgi:Tfp pilus assembly PilM family ATPase